jgi:hypothetical protein
VNDEYQYDEYVESSQDTYHYRFSGTAHLTGLAINHQENIEIYLEIIWPDSEICSCCTNRFKEFANVHEGHDHSVFGGSVRFGSSPFCAFTDPIISDITLMDDKMDAMITLLSRGWLSVRVSLSRTTTVTISVGNNLAPPDDDDDIVNLLYLVVVIYNHVCCIICIAGQHRIPHVRC